MLTLETMDVHYGDLQVLWDVGFEVHHGEIVVLVGANGAGKTTTIKTISALLHPARGRILFEGKSLVGKKPYEIIDMGIAHVPEGRRLFPEMSVEENLIMGSLAPRARANRTSTLEWVYSLFPKLKDRRRQNAGTLSGGEQQMVAVGRGLMARPSLLMLDEPSLGLAPILVHEIMNIIKNINQHGMTVLLVEQNVHLTLALCHRAYVMENGRIALTGTGAELMSNEHVKTAYLGI
jgi:branched-chain amino acid transport system ATP-binding protein